MYTFLPFNSAPSRLLHLDLNSCFATIEQQANPYLRGKPVAVCAYPTPNGCILAASVEAKRFGVKTGMRVKDGKALCPALLALPSDPAKYRCVHLGLRKILKTYTNDFYPKSIDEFVLNLEGYPCLKGKTMFDVAREIKRRIREEIGEWLTVSVGIAPNRFLAKTAAGLHKPDGLDEINKDNFLDIYSTLALTDLCGIANQNAGRLNRMGIASVLDFYKAPLSRLKAAFSSVYGYYWYLRLRGWEIDSVPFARRSYGNSYALPKPFRQLSDLAPILAKLVEKMGARLRRAGYKATGVHVAVWYRDGTAWHHGQTLPRALFDSREIYKAALAILKRSPRKPVRNLAVSCFQIQKNASLQLELFADRQRQENLVKSLDRVNNRWGNFVIHMGRMADTQKFVPDRIAFGNVKELEEFTFDPSA